MEMRAIVMDVDGALGALKTEPIFFIDLETDLGTPLEVVRRKSFSPRCRRDAGQRSANFSWSRLYSENGQPSVTEQPGLDLSGLADLGVYEDGQHHEFSAFLGRGGAVPWCTALLVPMSFFRRGSTACLPRYGCSSLEG